MHLVHHPHTLMQLLQHIQRDQIMMGTSLDHWSYVYHPCNCLMLQLIVWHITHIQDISCLMVDIVIDILGAPHNYLSTENTTIQRTTPHIPQSAIAVFIDISIWHQRPISHSHWRRQVMLLLLPHVEGGPPTLQRRSLWIIHQSKKHHRRHLGCAAKRLTMKHRQTHLMRLWKHIHYISLNLRMMPKTWEMWGNVTHHPMWVLCGPSSLPHP